MLEPIPDQPFWSIAESTEYRVAWYKFAKNHLSLSLINRSAVGEELRERNQTRSGIKPFHGSLWYEHFDNTPVLKLPTSYHPDYFFDQGLHFVSPKLFKLLNQPRGSLQSIPTETIWFGPEYPDWEYIWLSCIPRIPAIDTSDHDPEDLEEKIDPERGKVTRVVGFSMRLPWRTGLTSPFGTFRAEEAPSDVLVSDAVAVSVLRAGCTGLDFVHFETRHTPSGPHYRRGLHGVEIHPRHLKNE